MQAKMLSNLYLFCQVVEHGGLSSASLPTNTSAPTLSRAVSALEAACNEKLIHRNAKQFQLTAAGEDYYRRFSPLFEVVDTQWLAANHAQAELSGDIRVSCPAAFVEFFLQARAMEFMQQHPNINIIMHYAQNTQRFVESQMDIAITNTEVTEPHLMQKKLFDVPLGFAVSPDYLQLRGEPKHVSELVNHDVLSGSTSMPFWHVEQDGQVHKIPVKPRFQIDNINLIHEATLAGLGICLMPLPMVHRLVEQGKLVHILQNVTCQPNRTYSVVTNNSLQGLSSKTVLKYGETT